MLSNPDCSVQRVVLEIEICVHLFVGFIVLFFVSLIKRMSHIFHLFKKPYFWWCGKFGWEEEVVSNFKLEFMECCKYELRDPRLKILYLFMKPIYSSGGDGRKYNNAEQCSTMLNGE